MTALATDIASWATAVGVAVGAFQLRQARQNAMSQFESRFVERYEALLHRLPDDVVLELRELDKPSPVELRVLHDYYALCDEEVFYRRSGKVSAATWRDWERGMQLNVQRPTFRNAWTLLRINERLDQRFTEFEPCFDLLVARRHFDPRPNWLRRLRRQ